MNNANGAYTVMQERSISIDGPSGAGKSTLARALARELGYLYVDTGAIYRTVALRAREAGADTIACSSTGNAASSLAGNAAAAGLSTYIFVPSRAPRGKVAQLRIFGATVISVEGSYEDTFELSRAAIDRWGW